MKIKRDIQVSIEPTPEELAEVFWSMSSFNQAAFLERLAFISGDRWTWQLEYITKENGLSDGARYLMGKFGEYANHHKYTKKD